MRLSQRQHRQAPLQQQPPPARRQVPKAKQVEQVLPSLTATMVSRIGTLGLQLRKNGAARTGRVAHLIVMRDSARGRQLGPSRNGIGVVSTRQGVAPSIATRASKPGKLHGRLRKNCGAANMRGEVAHHRQHQLRELRPPHPPHRPHQPRKAAGLSPPRPQLQPLRQRQPKKRRLNRARLSRFRTTRRSSASLWQGRASR
mmetsp:Transcript_105515/g.204312  ORF Transcript_105515/g.204312 Transcript_105515/m.204312 type:complete len:200 (+) Transcript_105515:80-679(+)